MISYCPGRKHGVGRVAIQVPRLGFCRRSRHVWWARGRTALLYSVVSTLGLCLMQLSALSWHGRSCFTRAANLIFDGWALPARQAHACPTAYPFSVALAAVSSSTGTRLPCTSAAHLSPCVFLCFLRCISSSVMCTSIKQRSTVIASGGTVIRPEKSLGQVTLGGCWFRSKASKAGKHTYAAWPGSDYKRMRDEDVSSLLCDRR